MITRKLGKLIRGKVTPFQIIAACVLGALIGFMPSWRLAPGLAATLFATLLVVNANLGLALLVAGGAALLSYLAAPLSFAIGQFLLDGPTSGLAQAVVNAPVLAWFGLQYYAVSGGLLLGLLLGVTLGLLVARAVRKLQMRMAAAAQHPSRLHELSSRPLGKALIWIFFGGKGKGTWDEILARRVGNPVRVMGVVVVAVLGVGAFAAHRWIARTWARGNVEHRLERVNGATANVGALELDIRKGNFGIEALALADPEALERDLFRADELAADFDQVDILRRRVHMSKLVVSGARSGAPRETPGEIVVDEPDDGEERSEPGDDIWTLDEVLAKAELWKSRLETAKRVLDRMTGGKETAEGDEGYSERAARRAREAGWFDVEAEHLVDEAPTFRLSELVVDGLVADWLPGRLIDVRGRELSTHPWLVDDAATLEVATRDGAMGLAVDLAPVSRKGGKGGLRFHWRGLSVDYVMSLLRFDGAAPLAGGTLDLELDGAWADGRAGILDLPLRATFRGTTLSMPGITPTRVDELTLPIGLQGPLDRLRIRFDGETLAKALADAGKGELAKRVRGAVGEKVGEQLDALGEKAGIELPKELGGGLESGGKKLLEGVLGGKKKKDDG